MARRIAGVAALNLLSVLMAATCAAGRDFYVGGRAGWAPNPAEPFNAWAERNRFQVNDTLGESFSVPCLCRVVSLGVRLLRTWRPTTRLCCVCLSVCMRLTCLLTFRSRAVRSSCACMQCSGTARTRTPCCW